jgi:ABC-type glutathione transport system ATPase component
MTKERRLDSYADALFAAQRGFLIIGLTGYTGSGCTTTARMLCDDNKMDLSGTEDRLTKDRSDLSKRHFKRLQIAWGKTPWEPFTVIEVAAVIFALLAKAALEHEHPSGILRPGFAVHRHT